jgi:hypothetical protein
MSTVVEKPAFTGKLHVLKDHDALAGDADRVAEMRRQLREGDGFIAKNYIPRETIAKIRDYLAGVGRGSLPNYRRLERACPNFHRLNRIDERSYVKGCFHQFAFFPWNQDVFDFFGMFKRIFHAENVLNGYPRDKFLGLQPDDDCIARVAFQFYPKRVGELNKHRDSTDEHQLALPIVVCSQKGEHFKEGGAFLEKHDGEKYIIDDYADEGDVVYYNSQVPHGVLRIDPDAKEDWLSFEGRWMALLAVNKLFDSPNVANSVDLGK